MCSVNCNLNLHAYESIKKHINSPHGASLVAITLIDDLNPCIDMTVKLIDIYQIRYMFENMMAAFGKYKSITTLIRSIKVNDKYLSTYKNIDLQTQPNEQDGADFKRPMTTEEYCKKHAVVDIIIKTDNIDNININDNNDNYDIEVIDIKQVDFKVYRWNELVTRQLCLTL